MKDKVKVVLIFFIAALVLFSLVNVLQTIAWGQSNPAIPYPEFPVEVGRVTNVETGARSQWRTKGEFAVIPGKDAKLYIEYLKDTDEFYIVVQATKEHAATDGFIPVPKIVSKGMINQIWIEARDE